MKDELEDQIQAEHKEENEEEIKQTRNILPPVKETGGAAGVITVRGLAEGAMMTAIMIILAVISVYVPVLNLIAPLLFPVPLALIVLRHGLKLGILCAASELFLSSMLLGFPQALFLFIQLGFLGLFFGLCFRQKIKPVFTLFGGVITSSFGLLLSFMFFSLIMGISLDQLQDMARQILSEYVSIIQQSPNRDLIMGDMSPAVFIEYMQERFLRLLPSLLVAYSMMITWLCYILMCKLLRRFGFDVARLPIFSEWRLDWRFLWALIIALAMSGLGMRFGYDTVARIGDNLLTAFTPILLVCGISVLVWLLKSWRVSTFIKILVAFFIVQMFGITYTLLLLVGTFDPLFDFRRRITRRREKRQDG